MGSLGTRNAKLPFGYSGSTFLTDREALGSLTLVRSQELEGFVEGVFGNRNEMNLPERAHKALKTSLRFAHYS